MSDKRRGEAREISGPAKRVLMISYNYPPTGAGGSIRTTKLARYLPSCGWLPTVLTVGRERTRWSKGDASEGVFPGVKILRAPFPDILTSAKDFMVSKGFMKAAGPGAETLLSRSAGGSSGRRSPLERVLRWLKRWASFPDRYNLWIPFALMCGYKELRSGQYDAIYSSSPPIVDNILAAALQRLSGLPWVADFRDPWTQNPYLQFTPFELKATRALERKVLEGSSAIVTVSEPLAGMLRELHGDREGGVDCITNAFDPDDFRGHVEPPSDRFVITYAGMFYGDKRSPAGFMRAVEELLSEGAIDPDELLVRLYGPYDPLVQEVKASLTHPEVLEVNDVVSRQEVIEHERESTALLILVWDDAYSATGYGGKVFEYLGARRPILAWNPAGGVLDELLEQTGAGVSVSSHREVKAVLADWFKEWRATGAVAYRGHEVDIQSYGWDKHANDFALILNTISGARCD